MVGVVWTRVKAVAMAPETLVLFVAAILAVVAAVFPAAAAGVLTAAALMVMTGILWLAAKTNAARDRRVWIASGVVAATILGCLSWAGVTPLATAIITANVAVTAFLFADYHQRHARMVGVRKAKTKTKKPVITLAEPEEDEEVVS
jgi:hypothetical protein